MSSQNPFKAKPVEESKDKNEAVKIKLNTFSDVKKPNALGISITFPKNADFMDFLIATIDMGIFEFDESNLQVRILPSEGIGKVGVYNSNGELAINFLKAEHATAIQKLLNLSDPGYQDGTKLFFYPYAFSYEKGASLVVPQQSAPASKPQAPFVPLQQAKQGSSQKPAEVKENLEEGTIQFQTFKRTGKIELSLNFPSVKACQDFIHNFGESETLLFVDKPTRMIPIAPMAEKGGVGVFRSANGGLSINFATAAELGMFVAFADLSSSSDCYEIQGSVLSFKSKYLPYEDGKSLIVGTAAAKAKQKK